MPTSDIDLVVTDSMCGNIQNALRAVATALSRKGLAKSIQVGVVTSGRAWELCPMGPLTLWKRLWQNRQSCHGSFQEQAAKHVPCACLIQCFSYMHFMLHVGHCQGPRAHHQV